MAKTPAFPKLPRVPARVTPGKGQLVQVKDPVIRQLIGTLQDRISTVDRNVAAQQPFLLRANSPVNTFGQRVVNVATPVDPDDAVTLKYMQQFIATQAAVFARRAAAAAGEGGQNSNEFGIIGGGALPPLVATPNLLNDVKAYADAHPTDFANHCVTSGGSWAFMTGLIAYLQGIDPRVGGNGKRGDTSNPSLDVVAYWTQNMPPIVGGKSVYLFDVIAKSCSPEAEPAWINVTLSGVAGAWLTTVP